MGLLKSLTSSTSSALGDQFKEFVTCPTMDKETLVVRGIVNHGKGNKNYSENIISNGSAIIVPEKTAMMIIENGEIKEFSSEPGTYVWDTSSESSVFTGGFWKGIKETFKTIGKRFTYGGEPAKDQRVYYVNMLVLTGNKFGSPQPKKITDDNYGMLEVTFFGEYAYQIKDPIILVHNVIGANATDVVKSQDVVGSQLKANFIQELTKAITIVMRKHKVPFGDIGMYGTDISNEMNTILDESWHKNYGLEITDVAINDINLTEESMKRVSRIDDSKIFSNSNMQRGLMASSTAEAMVNASKNENGSMGAFVGMGMAQNVGINMMNGIKENNSDLTVNQTNNIEPGELFKKTTDKIFCSECGKEVSSKFCPYCGTKVEK